MQTCYEEFMDLKEYIKETLTQIAEGIQSSLEPVRDAGGFVNPAAETSVKISDTAHFANIGEGRNVFLIDFDIAVSVEETTGTNAAAKLKVASLLSLGAGGNSGNISSATNRVSFKVPMALPTDPVSTAELQQKKVEQQERINKMHQQSRQSSKW
jgi:hypothetical protein